MNLKCVVLVYQKCVGVWGCLLIQLFVHMNVVKRFIQKIRNKKMINTTIQQEKQRLREQWQDGTHCQCCNQYVKLYKRKINSTMAHRLITFWKYIEENNLHGQYIQAEEMFTEKKLKPCSDFAKLRWWGLIHAKKELRDDGSDRNGYYRLTADGLMFVRGLMRVDEYKCSFNQQIYRPENPVNQVSIQDCLRKAFNYQELMNG